MSIVDLPLETAEKILLEYDYEDLIKIFSQTSSFTLPRKAQEYINYAKLCKDPSFWKRKLQYDISNRGISPEIIYIESENKRRKIYISFLLEDGINPLNLNKPELYRQSLLERNIEACKALLTDNIIRKATKNLLIGNNYNPELINFITSTGFDMSFNKNFLLTMAAGGGSTVILSLLLETVKILPGDSRMFNLAIQNHRLRSENENIYYGSIPDYVGTIKLLLNDGRIDPTYNNNSVIQFCFLYEKVDIHLGSLLLEDDRVRSTLSEKDIEKYQKMLQQASNGDLPILQEIIILDFIPLTIENAIEGNKWKSLWKNIR